MHERANMIKSIRRIAPRLQPRRCSRSLHVAGDNPVLGVSEEVREAVHSKRPVVALETTIYTHGFPYPENVALAAELETIVRENGAVPATIGILNGQARVGLSSKELEELTSSAGHREVLKVSRRDLAYACSSALAGKSYNGGTTVAGTMVLAHLAGIKVFATGGLGGVHRGAESTMDISADLTELGRTPVAVICSGCKSFLDIGRTLEYLETEGVLVATFRDGRQEGPVDLPAFWARDSGIKSPATITGPGEAAKIIRVHLKRPLSKDTGANYQAADTQGALSLSSGMLFANPIPRSAAIPRSEIDAIITRAVREADERGIIGKDNTPFILSRIKELTGGASVRANRALVASNVRRGADVAKELSKLENASESPDPIKSRYSTALAYPLPPSFRSTAHPLRRSTATTTSRSVPSSFESISPSRPSNAGHTSTSPHEAPPPPPPTAPQPDILVAGAVAVDLACDYAPIPSQSSSNNNNPTADPPPSSSPQLSTSNPAVISESLGGVGYNVARAIQHLGQAVRFVSAVGDDARGHAALATLKAQALHADVRVAAAHRARTAQYVSVNDSNKDLVLAMADMSIFDQDSPPAPAATHLTDLLASTGQTPSKPRLVVLDANWDPQTAHRALAAAKAAPASFTALEPVSAAKAGRFLGAAYPASRTHPDALLDLATPNAVELAAMHGAARAAGLLDSPRWWACIDALGMPSGGARRAFTRLMPARFVDRGVPQQAIQLLPFVPCIITTLGADGVLVTALVDDDDGGPSDGGGGPGGLFRRAAAAEQDVEKNMLSRGAGGRGGIKGVYMRYFPPERVLGGDEIVSVNGAGDSFLGAVIAGLASRLGRRATERPGGIEELISVAQQAACLTLKSKESASPELRTLRRLLVH